MGACCHFVFLVYSKTFEIYFMINEFIEKRNWNFGTVVQTFLPLEKFKREIEYFSLQTRADAMDEKNFYQRQ